MFLAVEAKPHRGTRNVKDPYSPSGIQLSLFQRLRLALAGPFFTPFIEPPFDMAPHVVSEGLREDGPVVLDFAPNTTASKAPIQGIKPQSVDGLATYLALSPKNRRAIRPWHEFATTAPDLRGQVIELIDHLFVRYPVPLFLYRAMLSEAGLRLVFPGEGHERSKKMRLQKEAWLRDWFYAVAWGESFATLAKDRLNRREAHWFLQAPAHNDAIANLAWARVAALGVPPEACDFFLRKFQYFLPRLSEERKGDLARFYARAWGEMRPHEREEIADYVVSALNDPAFSFAGRTAGSVRRLSEAWHRRYAHVYVDDLRGVRGRNARWQRAFATWQEADGSLLVQATELTSARQLAEEGSHQGHCVASYAGACQRGQSRIVSFRWSEGGAEIARLTIEVSVARRAVVQIRGRRNRRAAPEETASVNRWAARHELTVASHA